MLDLFQSRKFWAAVISLAVIVVLTFFPGFQLDQDAFVGLVLIVVAYIVGLAIDPGSGKDKLANLLKSRKFWTAVVGMLVMVCDGFGVKLPLDVSPDQLIGLAVLMGGYIVGVALEGSPIEYDL